MPLLLDIPFEDKENVKLLGAKWDSKIKKWVVPNKSGYFTFSKWLIKDYDFVNIIYDSIYIIEGSTLCPHCRTKNTIITLGSDRIIEISNESFPYTFKDIVIFDNIENIPDNIIDFLKFNYLFFEEYNVEQKHTFFSSHCYKCNTVLQPEGWLLENLKESPFMDNLLNNKNRLIFKKFKLKYDFASRTDYRHYDEILILGEPIFIETDIVI